MYIVDICDIASTISSSSYSFLYGIQ